MKIYQIFNDMCHYNMTHLYHTVEEAKAHYPASVCIVEAPDYVFEGWGYDSTKLGDNRFIKPTPPKGWLYDEVTGAFYEKDSLLKQSISKLNSQIESIKLTLTATDYKIIKCSEYQLAGLDAPYDITTLHTERQALRDQINDLETQLAAAEAELAAKEAEEQNA